MRVCTEEPKPLISLNGTVKFNLSFNWWLKLFHLFINADVFKDSAT